MVNGVKKNITALKKLLKEVKEFPHTCPIEQLPLLMGTKFEESAKERLRKGL